MTRRRAPRPLAAAIHAVAGSVEPATPLAAVQAVWRDAVGARVAGEADPVAERAGVLTVHCRSAIWAEQLAALQGELIEKLNQELGEDVLRELRVRVGPGSGATPRP